MSEQKEDLEKSKAVVKEFLGKMYPGNTLPEQLEEFKGFDFMKLEKNSKYANCSFAFDADDTLLARCVYFVIWCNGDDEYRLPGLVSFDDIGTGRKYRGETLNTYNTLFGKKDMGVEKFFNNSDEETKTIIKKFRAKYRTIGNFMLLPDIRISVNIDKMGGMVEESVESINTYRGKSSKYRDFFDLSLQGLFGDSDENMPKLRDANKFYFDFMSEKNGRFCKINFLESYFNADGITVRENLFKHPNPNRPYQWYFTSETEKEEYRAFAMNYINKASAIIDDRAGRICEVLRERLS